MENGIGTGHFHSDSLANLVLLGFEFKNINIFVSELNKFKDPTETLVMLQFWKRYINDGRFFLKSTHI